jgi:hypothetical protein
MANLNGKYNMPGKLKRPERNTQKIAIISIAVIAFVSLSTWGTIHYMHKGSTNDPNDFGRQRRQWHDANMPDPDKQKPQEIISYMDSDKFQQLSAREQVMYSMAGGQQVMEYQADTYYTLPKEKKAAYLDEVIDRMQVLRKNFEKVPPRRPRDANDPNVQRRLARMQAARSNPANARARTERGTPEQRAMRTAFFQDLQSRMQQRGIRMPGPGGPGGGGRGGFGGGPGGGGGGRGRGQ